MNNKKIEEIKTQIKTYLTGGYFYDNNCRLNYSEKSGWYCKDYDGQRIRTYNITEAEATEKIAKSLINEQGEEK